MNTNFTDYNNTLVQVIDHLNSTFNDTVNASDVDSVVPVRDLYEEYRMRERSRLVVYRSIAYVLATLIVLSNLSVVVSSGLILKKGQKQKSTYLLLGNVSLADTIVGISIIYGISIDHTLSSNAICIFQMGMVVCPAMVSIFSVGLIAVDRYIYIVHGLYYQRWFNTTRVRIGIVLIWTIGITLGFMPATGWVNRELYQTRCYYVSLFPGTLILLNSLLSIVPIVVVAVLYTFILVKALQTVKTINNSVKVKEITPTTDVPKLRMNRRTLNAKTPNEPSESGPEKNDPKLKRSASFDFGKFLKPEFKCRSKSIEDLTRDKANRANPNNFRRNIDKRSKIQFESEFSVCTVESTASIRSSSVDSTNNLPNQFTKSTKSAKVRKIREPNKWRAITVVMLTSGSIIFTWIPYFVTVIFFVFCEEQLTNPRCIRLRALLGGPLAILAFVNSMMNPMIYAWWHKGFQKSVKAYYKQYLHKYICHVVR